MNIDQDIISIGMAAQTLQAMPNRIQEAALALGIDPALRINGVPYYSEIDLEKIAAHLRPPRDSHFNGVPHVMY